MFGAMNVGYARSESPPGRGTKNPIHDFSSYDLSGKSFMLVEVARGSILRNITAWRENMRACGGVSAEDYAVSQHSRGISLGHRSWPPLVHQG